MECISFTSNLTRDIFLQRIKENSDREWNIFGKCLVASHVKHDTFFLRRKRIFAGFYQGQLMGKIVQMEGFVEVNCIFKKGLLISTEMGFGAAFMIIIALTIFISNIEEALRSDFSMTERSVLGLVVLPLVIGILIFIRMVDRLFSENDMKYIIRFLRQVVQAENFSCNDDSIKESL